MRSNAGFTLIELMISIVLGLLVSAAAIQVLITGQRTLMIQQGSSDVQDGGSFGLQRMVDNIQLANLNATDRAVRITGTTPNGGIVLAAENTTTEIAKLAYSTSLLTKDNSTINSDQLTIQYTVPQVLTKGMPSSIHNCEGEVVSSTQARIENSYIDDIPSVIVTERYFLRVDDNASTTEGLPAFALACAAATNNKEKNKTLTGKENGVILIPRVDHFHYLLGVVTSGSSATRRIKYITASEYIAAYSTAPIVSIQLAMMIRSPQNVNGVQSELKMPAIMLDQDVNVTQPTGAQHYVRQIYTRTIALNNGIS